ncbi:hypothetical protein IV203_038507 [Nitzschia inconspicua]|uniref:Uncharacterized protein n=1 Tax=Nitzschia inconspicua TaxID=303405 RepID=A0A9K3LP32_9STRA|nr:hypothetical protein IV203_038507 [Nitzschia inconspicua]
MSWMSKRRQELSYQILGPTTLHLQHEFYLWISLVLLAISSFQSLYRNEVEAPFGSLIGDYKFIGLLALWLSRHLILRWATTWDPSDSLRPTFWGVCSHWITSYVMAGQYFDRPDPEVVAKQMGTQNYHGNIDNRQPGKTRAAIRDLMWPSLIYTWRYVKATLLYPLMDVCDTFVSSRAIQSKPLKRSAPSTPKANQSSASHRKQRRRNSGNVNPLSSVAATRTPSYYISYIRRTWKNYGPPLQMLIPIVTFAFYLFYGFFMEEEDEPPTPLTTQAYSSADSATVAGDLINGIGANVKPYGAYKRWPMPSLFHILFYTSFGGTMYSIMMYGRIVPPIPDLVAGSNVLKAMRNEAKHYQQQQTSGSGGNKSSKGNRTQKENLNLPWLEQCRSIVMENRFRLYCQMAVGRILESILVCILIPHTKFACRATGHCPNTYSWTDLAKILYHVGISSALRNDDAFKKPFGSFQIDRLPSIITLNSVIFITFALLLCQAVTLNRSYLGIMGYLTGEWTVVDTESDPSVLEGPGRPSPWDPRRRYKKGDLVAETTSPNFGKIVVYRATSNSPEGRPFDLYLRASHDLFRNELGHPASSQIIAFLSTLQFTWILVLMITILSYQIMGYDNSSLLWTFAANLVAIFGTIAVAMPPYSEIGKLSSDLTR